MSGASGSYQDTVTGRWNYTYDAFNRLATAVLTQTGNPNAPAYSYSYDQYGNRWKQHLTAGSGYEVNYTFNSSNRNTTSGFTYDGAGNLQADGITCTGTCWTYDDAGNLVSAPGASYLYDAVRNRVDRVSGGTRYDFVLGAAGQPLNEYDGSSSWVRTTGGLFTYANGMTYFNRTDNLGTPRASTDYTGAVQRTEGVLMGPFGDNFTETMSNLDFTGFAGGDWDSESNADHFGAREYAKTQGRWLTPDRHFSGGRFTSVQGAYAPLGIPLGSSSGNSSLMQWFLNGNSSTAFQAQNFGNLLNSVASLVSSNVSCRDVFGGG